MKAKRLWYILAVAAALAALLGFPALREAAGAAFAVVSPVTTGLCAAFVLNVPMSAIEAKLFPRPTRGRRRRAFALRRFTSLAIALLLALGVCALFIGLALPELLKAFEVLAESIPPLLGRAAEFLEAKLAEFNLGTQGLPDLEIDWSSAFSVIVAFLKDGSVNFIDGAAHFTTGLVGGVMDFAFSLIIALYILVQKERIGRAVRRALTAFAPPKLQERILSVASLAYRTFARFLGGQAAEALILGALCYIGMLALGLPFAEVVSVTVCVTAVVPIVGAIVGEAIGALLILTQSPVSALVFLVFILILQQVEGSLIYPKVVGDKVGLPGLLVLCAVLVGGNIGGVVGALVGVPATAVLYALYKDSVGRRMGASAARVR
ncbi:MAG: AI-2E family transporter [Clostridia bacterium]|nr:AI-2E family transporter [Clostridia bacterium]